MKVVLVNTNLPRSYNIKGVQLICENIYNTHIGLKYPIIRYHISYRQPGNLINVTPVMSTPTYRSLRGRDIMVVGFTNTYAIITYHH
jgi:hypothetical protein